MDFWKETNTVCREDHPMLSRSYASKEDFLQDYTKFYGEETKAKEFYLLVLAQLEKAILKGKIAKFKKLNNLIDYTNKVINHERLRIYYDDIDNPIRSTNLIILASKYNKIKILEYLFDSDSSVLNNLTEGIGRRTILPDDKDGTNHNAFYYAIRSENITLLDLLINRWPDNYFASRQEELEEIIANAYEELKLRNVPLSDEMQYFVEDKLLDYRFFSTEQQPSSNADLLTKTIQRIQLLLHCINLLKRDYWDTRKIDGSFLYAIKFIAQTIHILKGRLRSTYDRIPWEELEFCLVIFVSSRTSTQELNLFYCAILNKEKIMNYLENFADKLRDEVENINGDKPDCIPRGLSREEIVKKIIKNYPQFEGLYNDYHQVRDVYSLKRINDHIELAVSADAREDQGRYVIIRVLQIIGEHLKNTLESPKLSYSSSELLVLSLSQDARKYIIGLRDAISHAESLSKIMEIEENADVNFFSNIQDDLRKVGDVITEIFYKNRIQTIRILLTKIVEIETLEEIRAVLQELGTVDLGILTIPENFKTMKHEKFKKLIMELMDNIADKTNYENELFNKINNIINSSENQIENIGLDYLMGYRIFQALNYELNYNYYTDKSHFKNIKKEVNRILNNINAKINPYAFKEIVQLSNNIFRSAKSRIQNGIFFEVNRLIILIYSINDFGTGEIKWIEELKEKLKETKTEAKIILPEDKYNNQLERKVHELSSIVNKNSLSEFKNNQKLQALVKMFVLDIMSILHSSKDCLPNNILFLDDNAPVLHGRCLRNYLAHDNVLVDVLLSDPLLAVILTAKKLTQENIMKSKEKIGKLVNDDPDKLRAKFDQNLETITNQERMFVALEEGYLDDLKNCFEKGADVKGRSTINSWTALHFAAKGPISLEILKFILDQNLSVNVKDNSGETPLHVAVAHERQDIVNFFFKETDVDVDVKNDRRETPLHVAVRYGHRDIVEILLKNKANVFTRDSRTLAPLYWAIRNNRIDIAQILLRRDLNFDINETMGRFTALHVAAINGHLELVNFLVENGADFDSTTDNNEAPLHLATYNDNLEVVSALILRGANVNARTIDGMMPLHFAIGNGNVKMVNSLLKYGAYVNTSYTTATATPLHFAAHFGNLEILTTLLNQGADVHAKCINNVTPLYYATKNGHKEVVERLIHHGAQINLTGNNNPTALHVAVLNGHKDVAYMLIKNNADVNAQDPKGIPVIHAAAKHGNKEIIDLLIKNKADVNARCSNGGTSLHFAIEKANETAIDFLIRNEADINARDNEGFTPLHIAAIHGHKEIVKLLIDNNAYVNLEVIGDNTPQPLYAATEAGHKDIVDILIARGANIDDKNYIKTPLHCAIKFNRKEIVELLISKGAKVNAKDIETWSLPLITGNTDIVETLLKNKAYDVNYRDSNQLTPLHLAARNGHKKIVKALIKNGAYVHATCCNNDTPLLYAALNGFEEVVEILIANGAEVNLNYNKDRTPLHAAAIGGDSKVVKVLIDNKADIDINDNSKNAPVRLAVAGGHLEVVKILLQYKKVNINAKDEDGFALLHIASAGTNLELVKYLVDEGADVNARMFNGNKAIHLAAQNGFKECVEFFVSKGLSVNESGILHCAARNGHVEIVNYLIEQHADVNAKDTFAGLTPMHLAAEGGYRAVIEVLLKNGAIYNEVNSSFDVPLKFTTNKDVVKLLESTDKLFQAVKRNSCAEVQNYIKAGAVVNAKNTEGVRPLHYAAWKGYDEVVSVLLQSKANPNVVNNNGLTPLHYAAKFSHLKVVKFLLSYYAVYNAVSVRGETPSDLTKNKSITGLFRKVGYFFENIQTGNSRVIGHLQKIRDIDTVKAIMCARNRENKTLVVAAMHSNFPKVQQLKEIAQVDVSALINEAGKLYNLCDYQKALDIFNKAFEKRKYILGSDNPGTLDIQKSIAEVLIQQGYYQEALKLLEEILQKEKEMLGFDSKETLKTRSLLASVMDDLGKHEKAFNIYQKVYQKQKEILGFKDEVTLRTQSNMAEVMVTQGKYEEALNIFRSVYDNIKSKNYGDALRAQGNVAMALANQDNPEKALKLYEDLYEKQEKVLGINHSDTLATLHNIGLLHYKQKKYNKALAILKDVLNKDKQILNPNHPDIGKTQFNIANVLFDQHKWIGALKAYRECFDQLKPIWASNHPIILHIIKQMNAINIYSKLKGNNPSEVLNYLQKNINNAASNGDMQTIQILLEDGADANDKDDHGRTPLHYAISNGHADVVNILLKHGADVTAVTNKRNTPLHTASSKGYEEIAEMLLRRVSPDKLNNFINAKTTASGATSLHVAAQNGFLNIAVLLLKRGAIYNITNNEGKTPLDLCKNQNVAIILKLVEELFQNAKNGNVEIMDKLKVVKPDEMVAVTNARNNYNLTLLQVSITNKHQIIARKLSEMLKDSS